MNIEEILNTFHEKKELTGKMISLIQGSEEIRTALVHYFRENKDRVFAIQLLNTFIALRKAPDNDIINEDLMLASYILGLHQQIEDCLTIWEAKRIDFDTYCGIDIQLIPFAGVEKTITFLQTQHTTESKMALEYINDCLECGDFDHQEAYFNKDSLPWFV